MSNKQSKWTSFLKWVGAIPLSTEYRIGDVIISNVDGRKAVIVSVIPQSETFRVKVAYTDTDGDKDEIGFLDPKDIQHAK